jgi:DeoR/GlpR family transcriptional regulator of sugar metabolism
MLSEQRQKQILELLKEKESLDSKEIGKKLQIPLPTLWRDLNVLAAQGKILKSHGGASLKADSNFELHFSTRLKKNADAKMRIAEKAAELVSPGDIIALDTGTTAMFIARALKEKDNLTVVTASLGVAQELLGAKGIYTVLLGGDLKEEIMATAGPMTLQHIKNFRVDKYFLGAFGVDPMRGTQDAYLFEIETKKALMAISAETVLVADSAKFGKNSLGVVAEIKQIKKLITDSRLAKAHRTALQKSGVKIIEA